MTAAEYQEIINKPQSKMRNKKTVVDGIRFDSQLEANYYCTLKVLQRMGEVTDIELQPKFELYSGIRYIADFRVTYADGHEDIVDCKGFKTAVYRMKKKMFSEKYPHLKIVEVMA